MRIVEEDLVDCEPLHMRFIFKHPVGEGRREALRTFIEEWFDAKARQWIAAHQAGAQQQIFVEFCGAHIDGDDAVEAAADLMSPEWLQGLTEAIDRSFPDVDHLRLGMPLSGPATRAEFEWVHVPHGEVTLHDKCITISDVEISLHHVSLGQFEEFLRATGYRPSYDRIEDDGSLVDYMRINFGGSPKVPAFRVSHDDAVAYCRWAELRLPSEAELYAFFLLKAREGYQPEWGGECWVGDVNANGTCLACHGPYAWALQRSPPLLENHGQSYPRDYCDYPFIGFRVAKPTP